MKPLNFHPNLRPLLSEIITRHGQFLFADSWGAIWVIINANFDKSVFFKDEFCCSLTFGSGSENELESDFFKSPMLFSFGNECQNVPTDITIYFDYDNVLISPGNHVREAQDLYLQNFQ